MPTMNNGHGSPSATRPPAPRDRPRHARRARASPPPETAAPPHAGHLWLYALILLIVLGAIFAFVMVRKAHQSAQLKQATQTNGRADRPGRASRSRVGRGPPHAAGRGAGLHGKLGLRADQRLHQALAGRHRRAGEEGPVAGGNRGARHRAAVAAVAGQPRPGPGEPRPGARSPPPATTTFSTKHAVAQQDADNQNAQRRRAAGQRDGGAGRRRRASSTRWRSSRSSRRSMAWSPRGASTWAISSRRAAARPRPRGTSVAGTTPASGSSTELFRVAQTQVLRVYVTVPEHDSAEVVPGVSATHHPRLQSQRNGDGNAGAHLRVDRPDVADPAGRGGRQQRRRQAAARRLRAGPFRPEGAPSRRCSFPATR